MKFLIALALLAFCGCATNMQTNIPEGYVEKPEEKKCLIPRPGTTKTESETRLDDSACKNQVFYAYADCMVYKRGYVIMNCQ